jgi:kinesin family protein C2/C3
VLQRAHLLGTLQKRLESIRLENVSLKLKLQSMKEKMNKSSVGAAQLAVLQRQVANLKREKQEALAELNLHLAQLHPLIGTTLEKARQLKETSETSLREITAKYLQEQTMRKLLYNKVQELRGNIRVFCRVRRDDRGPSILQFPSENEVLVRKLAGGTETMEFEHCYGPESTQEQVFEDTKPLLLSCVDGYNVCIIAYGQTGGGAECLHKSGGQHPKRSMMGAGGRAG